MKLYVVYEPDDEDGVNDYIDTSTDLDAAMQKGQEALDHPAIDVICIAEVVVPTTVCCVMGTSNKVVKEQMGK